MAKLKIVLEDKAFNREIEKAIKRNPVETVKAVHECLLDLAGESAARAPIESGDLRNDCHAVLNQTTVYEKRSPKPITGKSLRAFGRVGYSLPYALRQHEELNYRHDRTDGYRILTGKNAGRTVNMVAGGESKFLEKPFKERLQRYVKRMKSIPKRVMK